MFNFYAPNYDDVSFIQDIFQGDNKIYLYGEI